MRRKDKMLQYKDVFASASDFDVIQSMNGFCLFLGPRNPESTEYCLDTIIQLLGIPDHIFYYPVEDDEEKIIPTKNKYYDISYIRDVRLKGVHKREWELNYGPQCLKEYLEIMPDYNPSTQIRVAFLRPVVHDLKMLKKEYKSPQELDRG